MESIGTVFPLLQDNEVLLGAQACMSSLAVPRTVRVGSSRWRTFTTLDHPYGESAGNLHHGSENASGCTKAR